MKKSMMGYVFHGIEDARLEELSIPKPIYGEAVYVFKRFWTNRG